MADMAFITDFLTKVEGPRQVRGYVPCNRISDGKGRNYIGAVGVPPCGVQYPATGDPSGFRAMGASGVTVATGCDLGQTDISTLCGYGLTDEGLLRKLDPYIGLKKSAALQRLFLLPLLLTVTEASSLDLAVHGGYLARYVRPAYDKASRVAFDDLPKEAQAVIFSCCYQKGCGGVRRDWPKLWSYLTRQNWARASNELCHGFRQYAGRRKLEGQLLAQIPSKPGFFRRCYDMIKRTLS